jgi:hypothetical protein
VAQVVVEALLLQGDKEGYDMVLPHMHYSVREESN